MAIAVVVSTASGWDVSFTARPNNVGVQLDTVCFTKDHKMSYVAVDYVHVEADTNRVPFRRHDEVPRGDACTVLASVFANDHKGDTFFGDPDGDYVIESSVHVEQK